MRQKEDTKLPCIQLMQLDLRRKDHISQLGALAGDVLVCNFAIHYFMNTLAALGRIRVQYIIISFMDGERIFTKL